MGINKTAEQIIRGDPSESNIDPPLYVFDTRVLDSKLLKNDMPELDPVVPAHLHAGIKQFVMGPKFSGAHPHLHGDAFNFLLYGTKLWLLFPPANAFFSKGSAIEWLLGHHDHSGTTNLHGVIQYPGDIVYVPASWGHAVVNLADCVGVALEYS